MPAFNLRIAADNAAFDDEPATEIARILRDTARRIEDGETPPFKVRDTNGNTVGEFADVPDHDHVIRAATDEPQYLNRYTCPQCGARWADVWTARCDDECPKCGTRDITPQSSQELV